MFANDRTLPRPEMTWAPAHPVNACWKSRRRKIYVDLFEAGIIDPTKVVRIALENAVSVASVLLLTEATMTEIPTEKKTSVPELEA